MEISIVGVKCVFFFFCFLFRYMAVSHPVSVHLYFLSDRFRGYLVRHVATNRASTQMETLETWVTPKDHFALASPPHANNRLQHIQVRTRAVRTQAVLLRAP